MTPADLDARRAAANLRKFRGGVLELLAGVEPPAGETVSVSPVSGFSRIDLPTIGLGTYRWNGGLGAAVEKVPFLDTAETYGYGRVEQALGGLPLPRRVATKVSRSHMSRRAVIRAAERSLARLGIARIWLYQIHWPIPDLSPALDAFQELVARRLIDYWGVCNFAVVQIEPLVKRGFIPATVQVRYNLQEREIEGYLLPYCRERGIRVLAYSPLGQDWRKYRRPVLSAVARVAGLTEVQVALGWLMSRGVVPIPATNSPEHLVENLTAEPLDKELARKCEAGYE